MDKTEQFPIGLMKYAFFHVLLNSVVETTLVQDEHEIP